MSSEEESAPSKVHSRQALIERNRLSLNATDWNLPGAVTPDIFGAGDVRCTRHGGEGRPNLLRKRVFNGGSECTMLKASVYSFK
jgi:hypothetical protein